MAEKVQLKEFGVSSGQREEGKEHYGCDVCFESIDLQETVRSCGLCLCGSGAYNSPKRATVVLHEKYLRAVQATQRMVMSMGYRQQKF